MKISEASMTLSTDWLTDFSPKLGFFADFVFISCRQEAIIQRVKLLRVNEPKKTGARSALKTQNKLLK
jgi:hypothetical protein